MNILVKIGASAAALALAAPAFAAGPPSDTPDQNDNPGIVHSPETTPPSNEGTGNKPATPGPSASLPAKARAYGRRCQWASKKRSDAVEGSKGTPFSQCVTGMARLATEDSSSPREACKALSKEHVGSEKRTPFARCVSEGAKLLREQRAHDD